MEDFLNSIEYRDLILSARAVVFVFAAWTWLWSLSGVVNIWKYRPIATDWVLSVLHLICVAVIILQLSFLTGMVEEYNSPWVVVGVSFLAVGMITATIVRKSVLTDAARIRKYMAYQQLCDAITDLAIVNPEAAEMHAMRIRARVIMTQIEKNKDRAV